MNKLSRSTAFPCAVALGLLAAATVAQAADDTIEVPKNPLIAGLNVDPNVLIAFDDSGSMIFEVLFKSQGTLYWDGSFIEDGVFRSSGQKYTTLFPQTGDGINTFKKTVPPVEQFAFTRSPQFNLQYFSPKIEYKPWPGNYADYRSNSADLESVRYVPKGVDGGNDSTIDLTTIESGIFVRSPGMPGLNGDYDCRKNNTGCTSHFRKYDYFAATFYLTAKNRKDARAEAGPDFSSYRLSAIERVRAKAPGYTGKIEFYRFQIRRSNFTDASDYYDAIGNFANWFAYNRTRALAVKNGMIRAFNNFENMNVGVCTINDRNFTDAIPYNLDANRDFFNDRVLSFAMGGGTPDAAALKFLGETFEEKKGVVTSPCQKNYAILFTDGYNSGVNPNTPDNDGDGVDNTMGDIAARYYHEMEVPPKPPDWDNKTDLDWAKQVKKDQVPTSNKCENNGHDPSIDCQQEMHVTFFGVTLGQTGKIFDTPDQPNPYETGSDLTPNKNDSLKSNVKTEIWPTKNELFGGTDRDAYYSYVPPTQVDDLWHATVNSRGALLNATRPTELAAKFSKVLEGVLGKELAGNNLSLNRNTASADTFFYQATFKGRRGLLQAYQFFTGGIPNFNEDPSAPGWAVAQGDIRDADSRKIFTRNSDTNRKFTTALDLPDSYKLNDAKVKYIRGDASNEGSDPGEFRPRSGYVLGDIVNSTPVHVGSVPGFAGFIGAFTDAPSYEDFLETTERTPALYVEANDGMLHAFDASKKSEGGGNELFAYIPEAVLPKIHELTQQTPANRFYADATVTVEDAVIGSEWATVLVAGLRAGGKSIFALDVTEPADFGTDDILWEITADDDGFEQLGLTYSQPQIARLAGGNWVAIFGNGYNSKDNKSVLYVVDLASGSLIRKFVVSDGGASDPRSGANGMSSPYTVDLNGDFVTDYVYAGDLHGNMWRFDLTSANTANWTATLLFQTSARSNNDGNPDTAPPARAITAAPTVSIGPPNVGACRGAMVFFGSGKYLERSDVASDTLDNLNYQYGIWDAKVGFGDCPPNDTFGSATVAVDELATRTLGTFQTTENGEFATLQNPGKTVLYEHGKTGGDYYRGWRLTPGANGQRFILQPSFTDKGNLNALSSAPSAKICKAGGTTFSTIVDRYTGAPTAEAAFDTNGDGVINADDKLQSTDGDGETSQTNPTTRKVDGVGIAGGTLDVTTTDGKEKRITTGSSGQSSDPAVSGGPAKKRISWREIRRG